MTLTHPFLSSNDAQALRDLTETLATNWLATTASICRFWRDEIATRPSLWADVLMPDHPHRLASVLPRSEQLPLRITLVVSPINDLWNVNFALRPHAHRLKSIQIDVRVRGPLAIDALDTGPIFDYPAPMLCELTLNWPSIYTRPLPYQLGDDLFNGEAPRLRSVKLTRSPLPLAGACSAFSNVTYVLLRDYGHREWQNVFAIFPALRRLELIDLHDPCILPSIPGGHGLKEVSVRDPLSDIDVTQLETQGYMRLPHLRVARKAGMSLVTDAAIAFAACADATLTIGEFGETEFLIRRVQGCDAVFASGGSHDLQPLRDALSGDAFRNIAHLTLPLYIRSAYRAELEGTVLCPLLRGKIDLPHLQSLTIRCTLSTRNKRCLLDPDVDRGIILAPSLSSIGIIPPAGATPDGSGIRTDHLCLFLERHLRVEDTACLNLFIDTAHGVRLETPGDADAAMTMQSPTVYRHEGSVSDEELRRKRTPGRNAHSSSAIRSLILTMTIAPPHPFLDSDDAQSLRDLVGRLAEDWIAGAASFSDVNALFSALHRVVSGSLALLARQWNQTHDRLRILPPELRDLCLVSLPVVDKCRLGLVCSSWHREITPLPAIWSEIELNTLDKTLALAAVLPRSGQLPVHLTLTALSRSDIQSINSSLSQHAHRIQSLKITFDDILCLNFAHPVPLFGYAVPLLRELSLDRISLIGNPESYSLPAGLFNGVAPRLRSITLRNVRLPSACRALSNASFVSLQGAYSHGLEHVFELFPSIRRLDLVGISSKTALPTIPPHHPIAEARLRSYAPSIAQLQDHGYLRLLRLRVTTRHGLSQLGDASRAFSALSHSTLEISPSGATKLTLCRAGGREATFSADGPFLREIRDVLRDGAFRDVARLVLPLHHDAPGPLVQGRIELPHLRTMQILCGSPRACSLLDPEMQRGVIAAPLLARVEFTADADAQPTCLRAMHVARFIETTLEPSDAAELFIDTARGVRLENQSDTGDEMDHLRACVGALQGTEMAKDKVGERAHVYGVGMLPIDHDDAALRQVLESDFGRLARGITDAPQISAIVTHLVTAAHRIVYDFASTWNKRSAISRLPDELVAASCAFLPLRDRLAASHVSRAWRHASLSFPSVWCDIEVTSRCRDPAAVIGMLLSRTGQLPVFFSYRDVSRDPDGYPAILRAIDEHMHHIESISWHTENMGPRSLTFTRPAPLLRSLTTNIWYCNLPENFLGGQRGSLRVLHVPLLRLPASCAAFSTVTDLRGAASEFMDDNETLRNLFTLFPCLETLWLNNLRDGIAHYMPHGPAPLSLTRLRLSTMSDVCDHAARYVAWKTPALTNVELIYDAPKPEIATAALRALFLDATELSAYLPNEAGDGAEIALHDAAGAKCRLRFAYPARDASAQFSSLLRIMEFAHLRTLSSELGVFKSVVARLPRDMQHITLHAHEIDFGREMPHAPHAPAFVRYPWMELDCLVTLATRCPSLVSVTLDVHALDSANPPSAQNARDLLDMMKTYGVQGIPALHLRGFSAATIAEVDGDPSVGACAVPIVFDS
ncbi:hypothetical protein AURDEDRAFT_125246 [Auricularia subglabra TFB-10046 SS5]|nr:hypothetical protein AURDEDRAFT_125246 [Auricularia subglabra TFB-10046 SS5]